MAKTTLAGTGITIEEPEVTPEAKAVTDKSNLEVAQIIKDLGLDEQMEQADLAKSVEFLSYVRGNPDSIEEWATYESWRGKRLRSKEPVGKLLNGKPKHVFIKVSNVCSRFLNRPISVSPTEVKEVKPRNISESSGKAQCIVFYNQMNSEDPERILIEPSGLAPIPASCPASVIAKHFQLA